MSIEDIQTREKAATPGDYYDSVGDVFQEGTRERIARCAGPRAYADARFFARAKGDIPYLLAQLRDRDKKLEAAEQKVEEQYKDGVCLWCGWRSGGSLEFHCCWVGAFDRILKEGE